MTGEAGRDPLTDPLTAGDAALVAIDYQPSQVQAVTSTDRELLVDNIVSVARLAGTLELPVGLSTVNVANGQGPTIPELKTALSESAEIDRWTSLARTTRANEVRPRPVDRWWTR
jgi:hypothetical protein